ncbi:hypothetical protein [Oceanobacillus sp. CFH 90083]|uniref:hypothetical protein n=1 Tax=Oceanobacillus sp. CFH 90083 TaxID=2592336 RepID=UPI00128C323F|nr:hypothetical protein [Oceanobacillus sp. CFH 90083]
MSGKNQSRKKERTCYILKKTWHSPKGMANALVWVAITRPIKTVGTAITRPIKTVALILGT